MNYNSAWRPTACFVPSYTRLRRVGIYLLLPIVNRQTIRRLEKIVMNLLMERLHSLRSLVPLIAGVIIFVNALADDIRVELSGSEEVPAVSSSALGSGTITIDDDRTVSGSITTTGMMGTTAHIHMAPAGKNGPPIVALTRTADNEWSVPAGTLLTDEQFANYRAGNLYINICSATYPSGEIRAQLAP
jgi:hypothetical protein